MPRGPAPQWKQRAEPVLDDHILASINAGPMNEETGHYTECVYVGISDKDRAQRIKRNLFNAAKHLGYSVKAEIESAGTGYQVRFTAIHKKFARAYILSKYGKDRSAWPYDPRMKGK